MTNTWTLTGTGTYTNPTGGRWADLPHRLEPGGRHRRRLLGSRVGLPLRRHLELHEPQEQHHHRCPDLRPRGSLHGELGGHHVRARPGAREGRHQGQRLDRHCPAPRSPTSRSAGGCRYPWSGAYVSPAARSQRVYRTSFSTIVPNILKPSVDLSHWYANAKPGPMSTTCSVGSFPGQFDNDTTLEPLERDAVPLPGLDLRLPGQRRQRQPARPDRVHAGQPGLLLSSTAWSSSTASSSSRATRT